MSGVAGGLKKRGLGEPASKVEAEGSIPKKRRHDDTSLGPTESGDELMTMDQTATESEAGTPGLAGESRPGTGQQGAARVSPLLTSLNAAELDFQLDHAIQNHPTAELVVLHIMKRFDVDLEVLKARINDRGLNLSFSKCTFRQVATLFNLDPTKDLRDIRTFEVQRCRIPLNDLKSILEEVDRAAKQFGPPEIHRNEETRSRYLSSLFNQPVSWFKTMIMNTPECMIEGRKASKGRVKYQFQVFRTCTILVIEMKREMGSLDERLDHIAQLIAELDACEYSNRRAGFFMPVFGVLCDGNTFEFFQFDSEGNISHGTLCGGNEDEKVKELTIPNLKRNNVHSYVKSLRPVCESFYWLFLRGYAIGIEAFLKRSKERSLLAGEPRHSMQGWTHALAKAVMALDSAMKGTQLHGSVDNNRAGEQLAIDARKLLAESIAFIPANETYNIDIAAKFDEEAFWHE